MKKQVKLIASALVFSMVFTLCSCNGGNTKETETEAPETTTTATTTVETTTETTEEPTTTTTEAPRQNYGFAEAIKVMTACVGKDAESSKAAFEEFFGFQLDPLDPDTAYDGHTMYYLQIDIDLDNTPCKYLVFDMNSDGKTINSVTFTTSLDEKNDILKAFDDLNAKAAELYGKPAEEYIQDTIELINYNVSKKVGFSLSAYFSDTSNGFTFGVYTK